MIRGHGDDAYLFDRKIVSNFSSNVYNEQDLSGLEDYLCKHISVIHSYPEPDAISLRNQIATKYSIYSDEICVTNGAIEAIYLIAQTFRGSRTSIVIPTFSEYEDACRIHDHELVFVRKLDEIKANTQLVWLCNPNNPNGLIYDKEYLIDFVRKHPEVFFVFDQSYAAFTQKVVLSTAEANQFKNLILLHSLTKCFAIPGLRLGYFTAAKETVSKINKYSMPWSVNNLALQAGRYLLDDESEDFSDLLKESQRVQVSLKSINGLEVYPSNMHFFLSRLEKGKAEDLKSYLIHTHGFLIRDASNFRGLDETHFRIAVQSKAENDLLINAIKEWIK